MWGEVMIDVDILVSVVLLLVVSFFLLSLFIVMIVFPTKSSKVPRLPIKRNSNSENKGDRK